ncbi:MAG: hypothetical protein LBP56_00140 [Odoribacteraceae bacterium]|jgi:hypothetical protein|nr:hypothetical protein [Odoribacteraceae bacterium]
MKQFFLSILCAGALFCACSDDNDDNDTSKNYQASDFIKENLAGAQKTFKRQVSDQPQTIALENGVQLLIPGGGVFTKNGQPITGEYTVEVTTMLKPSEIVLSGTNTNLISGLYLESDGFFHINVLHGGESVDPITSQFLTVTIPTDKEDGEWTYVWEGVVDKNDRFVWQEVPDTVVNAVDGERQGEWNMAFAQNKNFSFQFKKLGWFNCDIYWNMGDNTTVTVVLSGQFGSLATYGGGTGDTFVFFKAKDSNVIAQLYTEVNATTVQSYDNSMPLNAEGTLIAFSIKDGAYSLATKEIKITSGLQETLELLPVTKATVLTALKALDQ